MFACRRLINSLRNRAVNSNLLIINNFLFYDSFNCCFSFNSYYNYTCRSFDNSVIRSDNSISNCLTQQIVDSYSLACCTNNCDLTFASNNLHSRSIDFIVSCNSTFLANFDFDFTYIVSNELRSRNELLC